LGIDYIYVGTNPRLAERIRSYGVVLSDPKEGPPTKENLKHRESIKRYFNKNQTKHYLIDIKSSIENAVTLLKPNGCLE
jgi:hypothetical protein